MFLGRRATRGRVRRGVVCPVGPEHARLLTDLPQPRERLPHGGVAHLALQVHEEHVTAHPIALGPGLDLRQVYSAPAELAQTANEPAGAVRPRPPEHQRRLPIPTAPRTQWRSACPPTVLVTGCGPSSRARAGSIRGVPARL